MDKTQRDFIRTMTGPAYRPPTLPKDPWTVRALDYLVAALVGLLGLALLLGLVFTFGYLGHLGWAAA